MTQNNLIVSHHSPNKFVFVFQDMIYLKPSWYVINLLALSLLVWLLQSDYDVALLGVLVIISQQSWFNSNVTLGHRLIIILLFEFEFYCTEFFGLARYFWALFGCVLSCKLSKTLVLIMWFGVLKAFVGLMVAVLVFRFKVTILISHNSRDSSGPVLCVFESNTHIICILEIYCRGRGLKFVEELVEIVVSST